MLFKQKIIIFEYIPLPRRYERDLKVLEITGTEAVKRLRKRKLAAGKPFMINAKDLPVKQSYLEYPDNTISLVTIAEDQHSFTVLRNLSGNEATAIRRRFNLI